MDRTFITIESFKQALEQKTLPEVVAAVKTAPAIVRVVGEPIDRTLDFTISTSAVDRDGDVINQNGWRLDNFARGGSVLWAHDASQPAIAKPLATWLEDGALRSKAQFTPKEVYPFGYMIYEMYRDGYMRGCSVGFLPMKYVEATDRDGWMPLNFIEQELLEWSCTPVPSNPDAVSDAKAKGIDVSPMVAWAEALLDGESPNGLLVPRDALEGLHRAAKGDVLVQVETKTPVKGGAGGGKDLGDGRLLRAQDPATTPTLEGVQEQIKLVCDDIKVRSETLSADLKSLKDLLGDSPRVNDLLITLREIRDVLTGIVDVTPNAAPQSDANEFCIELPAVVQQEKQFNLDPQVIKNVLSQIMTARIEGLRPAIRDDVNGAIRRARGKVD